MSYELEIKLKCKQITNHSAYLHRKPYQNKKGALPFGNWKTEIFSCKYVENGIIFSKHEVDF